MITLLPSEISTLQSLQTAGLAAGNYADAYRYLRDIAQAQGASDVATWLDRAASINANDGSWSSEYVRGTTQAAVASNGQVLSDARFQEVSNLLAQAVIDKVIKGGGIPDAGIIIKQDVQNAVDKLGLQPWQWAGTLAYVGCNHYCTA